MCKSTFSDYISPNEDAIKFNAKLKPTTDYVYVITDRFGSKISKTFSTDANGLWEIPKTDLPDGFLAPGNKFSVEVITAVDDLSPLYMVVQQPVNKLDVQVLQTSGIEKDFIGGNWDN